MSANQFKIQRIDYSRLSSGKFVFLVYANPCHNVLWGGYSVHGVYNDTEIFVFPQEKKIIEPINNLCITGTVWEPSLEDFEKKTITLSDSIKRTAYFHFSLQSFTKPHILISFHPESITYDRHNKHWLNLDSVYWEIDLDEIRTHCDKLSICNYEYLEDEHLFGCRLLTSGCLQMKKFPGYTGDNNYVFISEVLLLSLQDKNDIRLWLYLIDAKGEEIGIIEGYQRKLEAKDFQDYVAFIDNNC